MLKQAFPLSLILGGECVLTTHYWLVCNFNVNDFLVECLILFNVLYVGLCVNGKRLPSKGGKVIRKAKLKL